MRLLRFVPLFALLAVVGVAAGCGGSGAKSVPSNSVAVVGNDNITKSEFTLLLSGTKSAYTAQKTAFPKPGTSQYKAQLKAQGLTEPLLAVNLRGQILSEKIYAKVTGNVKVTDADIKTYYDAHKSTYAQTASRDVRHILVNNKKLADTIEAQLKAGGDFAKLAKKYSKDPGSAAQGGKLTISKGQTVAPFDKVAFSLKLNELSAPVHTTYGWHIIQALSAVRPATQKPLKDVKASISTQLLQTKKTDVINKWVDGVNKEYLKKIAYQTGYTPLATTTTTTTTTTAATTTSK